MRRIYLVGLLVLALTYNVNGIYKLCAFPTMDRVSCNRIEEGNSNVTCVRVTDSVDCSNKLMNGTADFALYNAEEAVLSAKFINDYVNVVGEARYKPRAKDSNSVDLVVVVRKSFSGSFQDLQGKGYCHPGVGMSHTLTDKVLKSFERMVLPPRNCSDTTYPIAEQDIRNLELFFGPSCRPGTWAADDDLDNKLKRRYRNMCRLCENPSQCSNGIFTNGMQKSALDCLTVNGGDVAFVSSTAVNSYFGLTTGPASASPADYLYLCPNQTVLPINNSRGPCIWASQPWDLFVVRKAVNGELQDKLNVWMAEPKKSGSEAWQSHLRKLLLRDYNVFISRSVNSSLPVGKYINRGVADVETAHCDNKIKWCTTSDVENSKCKWLKAASQTFGIHPHLECSSRTISKVKCLQKISEHNSDMVSITTNEGLIARGEYNLSPVFFEDNLLSANYKIIAVIENTNGGINGFGDLRNKRACFPEYNGLSWMAFVNAVRMQGILGKSCPESFFVEGCAPGALLSEYNLGNRKPTPSLCNLCPPNDAGSCSPDIPRRDRNLRALQCLNNKGDIAFINLKEIIVGDRNPQIDPSIDPTMYKVLCRNGSIVQQVLNVDDDCALARGVNAEIMGRQDRTSVEDSNARELLLQLNKWFGTNEESSRSTISMYDQFQGQNGLIFEDNTLSLVDPSDTNYIYINYYKSLLSNVSQSCNKATSFGASIILICIASIAVLSIRRS